MSDDLKETQAEIEAVELTPSLRYRIFLSYGRDDGWNVQGLRTQLEAIEGVSVFMDVEEIEFGDAFRDRIVREMTQTDELLVVLSQSSLKRAWVYAEIGVALALGKRIVGLMNGIGAEDLRLNGALSLFGDRHHLFDPTSELDGYISQIRRRSSEKATSK